jgi:hypothetical protein
MKMLMGWILLLEIAMCIYGLVALITGKCRITRRLGASGAAARIAGLLMLLPLPISFALGLIVGMSMAARGQRELTPADAAFYRYLEIGITVVCLILSTVICLTGEPPTCQDRRRKRRRDDEDIEQDGGPYRHSHPKSRLPPMAIPVNDDSDLRSAESDNTSRGDNGPRNKNTVTVIGIVLGMTVLVASGTCVAYWSVSQSSDKGVAISDKGDPAGAKNGSTRQSQLVLPPQDADPLARALFWLKIPNSAQVSQGLTDLAKLEPSERRSEVLEAIKPYLTNRQSSVRHLALRAYARWADKEDAVTECLAAIDDPNFFTALAAIECLVQLRDQRAIGPIAKKLPQMAFHRDVAKALKTFGPAAEPSVLPYLRYEEPFIRKAAVSVLKEIGSAKCLSDLEKLANSDDVFTSSDAKEAVAAVKLRIASQNP